MDLPLGKELGFYGVDSNRFKLGSKVYEAIEDEGDGYRSSLNDINLALDQNIGNYIAEAGCKGVDAAAAIHKAPVRSGAVKGHRRLALPVWTLVKKALSAMKY
jgi:hypothetical protein